MSKVLYPAVCTVCGRTALVKEDEPCGVRCNGILKRRFQPNEVAVRKAEQLGDCRHWSPRDALLQALKDLDEGKMDPTALVIHYRARLGDPEGERYQHSYYAAGVTIMEHLGLLTLAQAQLLHQGD